MAAQQKPPRRIVYSVPFGLDDRIRAFAAENDFRNEKEAISALIEGALDNYPRWGVKKGIARAISAEVRALLMNKAREKAAEMVVELEEAMSSPPSEDIAPLVEPESDGGF